jgi:diphosphomevalonate decarboxylase
MATYSASAIACANIALIKYWGIEDSNINLPSNGSISMNLEQLKTKINIHFSESLVADKLIINDQIGNEEMMMRLSLFLDHIRHLAQIPYFALVESTSNIPIGSGIASSAAAYAALSLASTRALGLSLSEADLSRLARRGSGSASRSIPEGFVEWEKGFDDNTSYAYSIASQNHWSLCDCIAIIDTLPKKFSSLMGHILAKTSPLQNARIHDTERRLNLCRKAIAHQNFNLLAEVAELDSNLLHAVAMTSRPAVIYWDPITLDLIKKIPQWRADGLPIFFTIDAGPNLHAICTQDVKEIVINKLLQSGVQRVIESRVGGSCTLSD